MAVLTRFNRGKINVAPFQTELLYALGCFW